MRKPLAVAATLLLLLTACVRANAHPADPPRAAAVDHHLVVGDGDVTAHVPTRHSTIGVVVLHSLGHTAAEPVKQGWSKLSDRERFVGIYPERGDSWNAGLCCGAAQQTKRADVEWLSSVIATTRELYGLRTIYLVGFSNGGMMAERLVAERPTVSSCLAVWGAAPEMPTPGVWRGQAFIYDGRLDIIVPSRGGQKMIGGRPTVIRPSLVTAFWLRGANLHRIEVAGYGHAPAPNWPQQVWDGFRSCR